MILLKFREKDGRRSIVETYAYSSGIGISYGKQRKTDDEWREVCSFLNINITKSFAIGSKHIYYDGPHCFFSIGFLHFGWESHNCKKCYADGFEE